MNIQTAKLDALEACFQELFASTHSEFLDGTVKVRIERLGFQIFELRGLSPRVDAETMRLIELDKIAALSDSIPDRVPAEGIGRMALARKVCSAKTRHRFEPALQRAIDGELVEVEEGRIKRVDCCPLCNNISDSRKLHGTA